MHQVVRAVVAPSMEGTNEARTAGMLREQAERCRRLAEATTDREIAERLLELAREFEAEAAALDEKSAQE